MVGEAKLYFGGDQMVSRRRDRNRSQRSGGHSHDGCSRLDLLPDHNPNPEREVTTDEAQLESPFHIILNTIGISQEYSSLILSYILMIILVLILFSNLGKQEKDNQIMIHQTKKNECPAKFLGLVGVETTYESADVRAALRTTWFPADRDAYLRETGLAIVFVIGKTKGTRKREIEKENLKYGDILILKEGEHKSQLDKTLAFFKAASKKFDAQYYIKTDDHIYLRPDRLATMLSSKKPEPLEYIGCKKIKRHINKKKDFVFAHGTLYILSSRAVKKLIGASRQSLLRYKSEDVAVGYAMHKAFVQLEEHNDLCESDCTPKFIAVSTFSSCSTGPCNPINKLKELHSRCFITPTGYSTV